MTSTIRLCAIAALLAGSTIALSAHHTISAFYAVTQHATVRGIVTNVEWKNPHSFIHLQVNGDNGRVAQWDIETQARFVLRQRNAGLEDAIKPGETVAVTVCVAKDGASKGWLRELVTQAGLTIELSGAC